VFVQTEALIDERLMLTAGMRADRSSNNGNISKFYTFPKFSGSFRVPEHQTGAARRAQGPRGVWRDGQRAAVRAKVHHAQLE
jgi:hypothetical protein